MKDLGRFLTQKGLAATVAITMAALFAADCSSGQPRDVTVTWHLVDGRSCLDTAMTTVNVSMQGGVSTGTMATGSCYAQTSSNRIQLSGVQPGAQINVQGLSANSAVLYRGTLLVNSPVPATIDIPLYYTGGQ